LQMPFLHAMIRLHALDKVSGECSFLIRDI